MQRGISGKREVNVVTRSAFERLSLGHGHGIEFSIQTNGRRGWKTHTKRRSTWAMFKWKTQLPLITDTEMWTLSNRNVLEMACGSDELHWMETGVGPSQH